LGASLWASPAALVLLVAWWRGLRGVLAAAFSMVAGASLHAALAGDAPFDLLTFTVVGAAVVVGYGVAGLVLRAAHVDLHRPDRRDVVRLLAIAVVAAPVLVGAGLGTYLTRDGSLEDHV